MQEIHSISSSRSILILHILAIFILAIFLIGYTLGLVAVGILLSRGGAVGRRSYRLEASCYAILGIKGILE